MASVRLMEGWHHVDLTTRLGQSCRMITLQTLDTALACSRANLNSLLFTRLTTSIPVHPWLLNERSQGISQIDGALRHHVDLTTRLSQSCHMATLQALDTALARSHANLNSLRLHLAE